MEREEGMERGREVTYIARLRIKKKLLGGLTSFPGHSQILSHRANTTSMKRCKTFVKIPKFCISSTDGFTTTVYICN